MNDKKSNSEEVTKVENAPEQNTEISEIESVLLNLDASFSKVAAFPEPLKREYEMFKEAKKLDIPVESYRRMFENYYLDKNAKKDQYPWLKPVRFLDQRLGDFVKWCENISLYSLATVIGQFTLLAAMGTYFIEAPQRRQQAIDAARLEIRNQKDIEYSQARIEAMETLNKFCENILGEKSPQANLAGVKLNNCYQFQLGQETFSQWPSQFFKYQWFDLSQMNLAGANLKGANLEEANLEGANLEGASLEKVNLKGANLKGANLKGAFLLDANLEGANLEEVNLDDSRMSRTNCRGANLKKASLINARVLWSDFQDAKLIQANFQNSNLIRSNFQGASLYKANFKKALLRCYPLLLMKQKF